MAYGTGAEFYGIGEPDPGPAPVRRASGPRKLYSQTQFDGEDIPDIGIGCRPQFMARDAERAMKWFRDQERQGVKIHWHTLEFRIARTGMESDSDVELWRWEVWGE